MAFKDELQRLAVQVKERMVHITNEEMTKQALIVPFFQMMGFDVFNPVEFRAEYSADFGKKKGEKVDYALFKDNEPIMFIEAKSVNENLNNHDAQLCRYFNSTTNMK
ncbi:MAG: type I restriction endonuclease, partial [Anaeroplasmataceae bacterium]